MEDIKTPLEILDLRHHLRERLHFGENVDKGLGVIESCQDLLGESFLDVVNCFLFG